MKYQFFLAALLTSLLLSFEVTSSFAQDQSQILAANRKKGIYRNFEEFINNAPSIHAPFMILTYSNMDRIENGTADYRVMLLDTATRKRDLRKFWGVYDGENVYINEVVYGGRVNFKKMHGFGRYCYFKGSRTDNGGKVGFAALATGLVGAAVTAAVIEIDGDYPYVLNVNNGQVYLLHRETLKLILQKDTDLLSEYEEDERRSKRTTMLSYIAKYNERHADEIKYSRPIDVIFYRKGKKELIDPINVTVGDTTLLLTPNSLRHISSFSDSIDVCIGSNCRTIPLQKNVVNYVECSWRSEEMEFKKVDKKAGEFYEREIRLAERP
jgi:hypothetical protein